MAVHGSDAVIALHHETALDSRQLGTGFVTAVRQDVLRHWSRAMHPRVTGVRVLSGFTIELTFADGSHATLDMEPWIRGRSGMFGPLQDPAYFALVTVNPEAGTIVWPNDADLDPDVRTQAQPAMEAPGSASILSQSQA